MTTIDRRALAAALAGIHERMAQAARRAGRLAESVRLVAVSKTHPAERVLAALDCGQTDFGENRVEEAGPKMAAVGAAQARWHLVGHVQSRKARDVARAGFELVHSVDSLKVAERLSQAAVALGRVQPVLLECNVSGEASKSGFTAADGTGWVALLASWGPLLELPGVKVCGLMTIAPLGTDHDTARPFFRRLRELREAARSRWPGAEWRDLSMGMTDDFEGAIAEGATLIRIGRAIFGERA